MKLVAGLGNPGKKYKSNRHNVGFLVLDRVAENLKLKFKKNRLYDFCKTDDAILIKPKTFMNRSGDAITSVKTSQPIDDILIVVDDIYLPLGEIRLRQNGSFGGHNGLKSIGETLGSSSFRRMRIGVGQPDSGQLSDYVLSDFSQEENEKLQVILDFAEVLLKDYIAVGYDQMVATYSSIKTSYSEKI